MGALKMEATLVSQWKHCGLKHDKRGFSILSQETKQVIKNKHTSKQTNNNNNKQENKQNRRKHTNNNNNKKKQQQQKNKKNRSKQTPPLF